jgi:glycosyltransferase involved in cell wall biosynthesis
MACALPTVVFESEVNREILGDEGIYAEFGNLTSLSECIIATLSDRGGMAELGQRARKRAVEVHSWDARATLLVWSYENLLTR